MNITTSLVARSRRGRALIVVVGIAGAAVATSAFRETGHVRVVTAAQAPTPAEVAAAYGNEALSAPPATRDASSTAVVLAGLDPAERQFVVGVMTLSPAQIAAGYGNEPVDSRTTTALASLDSRERAYVEAVMAMSAERRAAVYGLTNAAVR